MGHCFGAEEEATDFEMLDCSQLTDLDQENFLKRMVYMLPKHFLI